MLPKVTMKAPPQITGGQIQASQSGKNYHLDDAGLVVVDSVDVRDLLGMGFVQVESDGSDADQAQTTTSVSTTSATQGAHALNPDDRQVNQRAETVAPGDVATSQDFGGAIPPHGLPQPSTDTSGTAKADAENEADTKAAAGGDPAQASAQANTGHPNTPAGTEQQQSAAAEGVKA